MLTLLRSRRFAPLFFTQLLGALNDNLFKSALVITLTFGVTARTEVSLDALVNMSSALLILPFFLFSALAGQLADNFDKAWLTRTLKRVEFGVMLLAVLGFQLNSLPLLFAALFMMGTQSAFFGPVKYAILPQHLHVDELVAGNGLVEMGTFTAILAGTILGGLVVAIPGIGTTLLSASLLLVAVSGYVVSRAMPAAPPTTRRALDWNLLRSTRDTLRLARRDRGIWLSILGASWFWFVGALLLAQFPVFTREVLNGDEYVVTALLAIFSVGIGLGSVACEKLTSGRIDVAIVPVAGALMVAALLDLALGSASRAVPVDAIGPLAMPPRVALDLLLLGASGGLFIVPLYAVMQHRAKPDERSRVIAANNIVNALFMVVAALFAVLVRAAGASIPTLFLITALLHALVVLFVAAQVHRRLLRLVMGRVIRTLYRVRARGLEHLPEEGGALVVANHVSFVDALILGGLAHRPIRFVMYHRFFTIPGTRWFWRLAGAIPIAPRREDAAMMERAFESIDRALADGDVVGIFPEGKLTTDGKIDDFRPGIERILARRAVPVVPIALCGLWGSFFSHAGGKPMSTRPRRFWSRVEVVCGEPVDARHASAEEIRERVLALRGDLP
ncbi:MAG: MFS transporter [Deltaproteobacteria bacterium]|nr:MFS transporter [Deltaproteobacteria bacterium]